MNRLIDTNPRHLLVAVSSPEADEIVWRLVMKKKVQLGYADVEPRAARRTGGLRLSREA